MFICCFNIIWFHYSLLLLVLLQITPSKANKNSVFIRLLDSISPSFRSHNKESISSRKRCWYLFCKIYLSQQVKSIQICFVNTELYSGSVYHLSEIDLVFYNLPINIMEGWSSRATANSARTNFSPSPTWNRTSEFRYSTVICGKMLCFLVYYPMHELKVYSLVTYPFWCQCGSTDIEKCCFCLMGNSFSLKVAVEKQVIKQSLHSKLHACYKGTWDY